MKHLKIILSVLSLSLAGLSLSSNSYANGFGLVTTSHNNNGFSYKSSKSGSASAINYYRDGGGSGLGTVAYHVISHDDMFYFGYGAQIEIPDSGVSLSGGADAAFDLLNLVDFQAPVGINKVFSNQIEVYIEAILTVNTSDTANVGIDNAFGIRFYP